MNGKVRYTGTEKIEKKIYDDIEELMDSRFSEIAEETRTSVIQEIRDELQPETVPYDRLRHIEHRIHEIKTTQDGIVREIVDLKTTLQTLAREMEKLKYPKTFETSPLYTPYSTPAVSTAPLSQPYHQPAVEHFKLNDKNTYTPYDSIRPVTQPPGFSNSTGPATPITPITFNSRKTDGWEYQEFIPAKKNYAEPEKFVPAKVIPAKNDPFYFGDAEEEVIDVFPLTNPAPVPDLPLSPPPVENRPLTIQKIPKEQPPEKPDKSEYIIGSNKGPKQEDPEEDYNANCEYIIAEQNRGSRRFGKGQNRSGAEKKEHIVSVDEDGTEVITYD
ncbi:MAG: hypothetical protein FWH46_06880 [Methanimicrococcus sp.]|nr:hypothetical protein [Methanimicrococcus sp.]